MYIVSAILFSAYAFVYILGKKNKQSPSEGGIKGFFMVIAMEIVEDFELLRKMYEQHLGRDSPKSLPENKRRIMSALLRLTPGEKPEKLYREYVVKKLTLSLMVVLFGTLLAAGMHFKNRSERGEISDGVISRGDINSESTDYSLSAKTEDGEYEINVKVDPRRLSEDEIEALLPVFYERLMLSLMGENESLDTVTQDLNFVRKVEGFPFLVEWSSSDTEAVAAGSGKVLDVKENKEVILTAKIKYGKTNFEKDFKVTVIPKDAGDDLFASGLNKEIEIAQEKTLEEESFVLPENYAGKQIRWQRSVKDYSPYIFFGVVFIAVLIYKMSDKDLHDGLEERKKSLKKAYPDFLQKMVLYIGAGMTVRGAFQQTASASEDNNPLREEMLYTCREMKSGIPEADAYDRFGRRCGLQEYIRMATLLGQDIKRGSSNLLIRLRKEADMAAAERLQNCRKAGEEAVTKLLLPMMLMLLVVMVMILLPAFSNMVF